jgi:hypothetical protein
LAAWGKGSALRYWFHSYAARERAGIPGGEDLLQHDRTLPVIGKDPWEYRKDGSKRGGMAEEGGDPRKRSGISSRVRQQERLGPPETKAFL